MQVMQPTFTLKVQISNLQSSNLQNLKPSKLFHELNRVRVFHEVISRDHMKLRRSYLSFKVGKDNAEKR